jgi:hypothetical protein
VDKDEALRMALEAFKWNYNTDLDNIPACEKWAKMLKENIAAIREALTQPEQIVPSDHPNSHQLKQEPDYLTAAYMSGFYDGKNKYAPQRQWVGLTADEIWKCNKAQIGSAVEVHICSAHQNVLDFAEAIEAKLREKNT